MKTIFSAVAIIVFFIATSAFTSIETKIVQYKFAITNIKTQADCDKIDKMMLERKGILASKTDLATKMIIVKVESQITFDGLAKVVVVCGFEPSESYQITDVTTSSTH